MVSRRDTEAGSATSGLAARVIAITTLSVMAMVGLVCDQFTRSDASREKCRRSSAKTNRAILAGRNQLCLSGQRRARA